MTRGTCYICKQPDVVLHRWLQTPFHLCWECLGRVAERAAGAAAKDAGPERAGV